MYVSGFLPYRNVQLVTRGGDAMVIVGALHWHKRIVIVLQERYSYVINPFIESA